MPLYTFEGRKPSVHRSAYVFPGAVLIGDVRIGEKTWIGPGAVLRGDYGTVEVGSYSAIEDNCVVHARPGMKTSIGSHVTVGHASVIHTAVVDDWAIIGMGAVVSDFAHVGVWAAIGEGAVVKNKSVIRDGAIAIGVPAKEVGEVDEEYKSLWTKYKENYNSFCERYARNLSVAGDEGE
ncbi:MAG: gamma carbonic anhydrase family protein [Methanomassiliicoccales archaeon]